MKKYDVWFCDCGHIQTMPTEYIEWMTKDASHRRVIRVCQHCGNTRVIWLDTFMDGFSINSSDFRDKEINTKDTDIEYRIIFSDGIRVPMMCGGYADFFTGDKFVNYEYMEADTQRSYDIMIDNTKYTTVNMEAFIKQNDPDVLKSIAGYYVEGLDWSGTEYELKI